MVSETERNKGKLTPTGINTEHFTEDNNYEDYYHEGFAIINGEIYSVQWEVKRDTDCSDFADVEVNEDGSIDFHTIHYNGGGRWTEVIEEALNGGN